jgi:hypothetical protein
MEKIVAAADVFLKIYIFNLCNTLKLAKSGECVLVYSPTSCDINVCLSYFPLFALDLRDY